ncbi:MAG: hypothetical protein WKF79_01990 [Nocardioides sp.]
MGAWGPAIFSDDVACDIRSDYRELLEDGADDADATIRVIADYQHLDEDQVHVLWLALGSAQSALGRLDETVKAEALRIIDDGTGLELWAEAGTKELARRKAALAKLRDTLTGPQKTPAGVRKPWSHETDLSPGDVLAYALPDGTRAIFRVARLDQHRVGTAPILRRLNWAKPSVPMNQKIAKLKPLPETRPMDDNPSVSFRVARHRKKDEDWKKWASLLSVVSLRRLRM